MWKALMPVTSDTKNSFINGLKEVECGVTQEEEDALAPYLSRERKATGTTKKIDCMFHGVLLSLLLKYTDT